MVLNWTMMTMTAKDIVMLVCFLWSYSQPWLYLMAAHRLSSLIFAKLLLFVIDFSVL